MFAKKYIKFISVVMNMKKYLKKKNQLKYGLINNIGEYQEIYNHA